MFSAIELVSGLVAGTVTTVVVHPLDLIKTRLQLDTSSSGRVGRSLLVARNVWQNEGGINGLYRGLTPNLIGNASSWALYFYCYDAIKTSFRSGNQAENAQLRAFDYLLASAAAGILTTAITNPIWVIKTRMLSTSSSHKHAYQSIMQGTRNTYHQEGWRGFYRGLVPSTIGVSHGAVQFMLYERLKETRLMAGAEHDTSPSNWELLLYSSLSKIVAASVTYPYQVVRSRLQTYDADNTYRGLRDVLAKIWRKEGVSGFYKGLGPNLIRIVPSSCVTFLVYENTKVFLRRRPDQIAEA